MFFYIVDIYVHIYLYFATISWLDDDIYLRSLEKGGLIVFSDVEDYSIFLSSICDMPLCKIQILYWVLKKDS